ncbi:VirK family protein [Bradyrhizobium arachidis]|uniref:VirK family protein n=2 Tax=Nitrobacteraceae TaxID=41294 RepID=UPI000550E9B8|nr:VirK family protein [Bradyrhizobium arachidis]UFW52019.1 VirK family protein [Bradyrhizobium arachidis]
MLVDLSACQVHGTNAAGPPIKASMRFDGYMIQPDGTIAFATTHFTMRPDRAVREFLSFRVHSNGKIEARTMTSDAVNNAVLKDAAFDCAIGKGATFHW